MCLHAGVLISSSREAPAVIIMDIFAEQETFTLFILPFLCLLMPTCYFTTVVKGMGIGLTYRVRT